MKIERAEEISSPREEPASPSGPQERKDKGRRGNGGKFPMPWNKSRLVRRGEYLFPSRFIRSISSRSPRGVFAGKRVALSFGLSLLSEAEWRESRSLFAFFTAANANGARIRSPLARLPAFDGRPKSPPLDRRGDRALNHRHGRNNKMQICTVPGERSSWTCRRNLCSGHL